MNWDTINPWIKFVLIIAVTFVLAEILRGIFRRLLRNRSGLMKIDPTNYRFFMHTMSALVYLVGFGVAAYQVPTLQKLGNSVLAGAGIMAVAIGFASQHALSNVISGFFIVLFKPFRINDRLQVQNYLGIVEDITLRHVVIRDFENRRILIPNTVISDEIVINANFSEDNIVKWVDVTLTYDSDFEKAKEIMRTLAEAHPLSLDNRNPEQLTKGDPRNPVRVTALTNIGVQVRLWTFASDNANAFVLGCDLYEQIKKEFDEAGIKLAVVPVVSAAK